MSEPGVFPRRPAQAVAFLEALRADGKILGYAWDVEELGTVTLLVPLDAKDEDFDPELFGYKVNLLRSSDPAPQ